MNLLIPIILIVIGFISLIILGYLARKRKWKIFKILYKSENPLIIAILLSIATLFVGPYLNQCFEEQRIKSEYILDNLKNLKLDTLQLFSNIQKLNNDKLNPTFLQIENDGLRLRYRILEIESVLGENQFTKEFQNNLTTLLQNIHEEPTKRYIYLGNFVTSSRNLSIYLAKVANIASDEIKFYKIENLKQN